MSKNNTDKNEAGRTEPSKNAKKNTKNNKQDANKVALNVLRKTADKLGINYHPATGLEKLEAKINEYLDAQEIIDAKNSQAYKSMSTSNKNETTSKVETEGERRNRIVKEATKLVRISVTNMNPNTKEWDGMVFTAGNSVVPTQRKYVPFGQKPWHVPYIIYQQMKERKVQLFKKEKINGKELVRGYNVPEFSIEVLPDLTYKELEDLRKEQSMSNRLND